MNLTVVSTSLDPDSRSAWLCRLAAEQLLLAGHHVTQLDLRADPLPPFDNAHCYAHPAYRQYHAAIAGADGVFLGLPVYNWGVGSGARALVELTGSTDAGRGLQGAWFDRPVTLLVSGGLHHGYLSHTAFAAGLMTDFKCVINPHFVYAIGAEWAAPGVPGAWLAGRLQGVVERGMDLSQRLAGRHYQSVWEV
jgi:chromate reductase, NAD(P)H dehydrogenase (quinone)